MHGWLRWREPLAVVLLAALAGMLVVRGIGAGYVLGGPLSPGLLAAVPGGDRLLLLAAAAAVAWCATPLSSAGPGAAGSSGDAASRHAWPIALVGLVVVGLTVLGWVALVVVDVITLVSGAGAQPTLLLWLAEGVLGLAVPVVAGVLVVAAVRRLAGSRADAASPASAEPAAVEPDTAAADGADGSDRLPAAWQAGEAAGAVWLTADDAAQGRPGLRWTETGGEPGPESTPAEQPEQIAGPEQPQQPARPAPPPLESAAEDDDLR